jgi:hypothetical protein
VELIASGRDADVWALDAERVLRRYRNGRDMDREASVMRHAAAHVGGLVDVPAATARELLEALLRVTGPADPVQLQAAVAGRTANPTLSAAEKSNLPTAAALVLHSASHA